MTYSTQTNHLAARASLEKAVEEAVRVLRLPIGDRAYRMREAHLLLTVAAASADLLLEHAVEESEHVFELNGVAA